MPAVNLLANDRGQLLVWQLSFQDGMPDGRPDGPIVAVEIAATEDLAKAAADIRMRRVRRGEPGPWEDYSVGGTIQRRYVPGLPYVSGIWQYVERRFLLTTTEGLGRVV